MSKARYYKLELFPEYFNDLKERKTDFELTMTNYSRKIKTDNSTVIFNQDGGTDYIQLRLINRVRKDAKNYLDLISNDTLGTSYINFFDLLQRPNFNDVVSKVDVKSAYWNYALKRGIITDYTDHDLMHWWDGEPAADMKKARLKALGSLATSKRIVKYVGGEKVEGSEIVETQPTKELYMDVCRGVDDLMKECAQEVKNCYYYYWDCMFCNEDTKQDVIDFIKHKEYDVTVKDTLLEYVEVGSAGYLVSTQDSKIYMVRKESKHILENLLNIDTKNILEDLLSGQAILLTDRRQIDCLMDYLPSSFMDNKPQMVDFKLEDAKPLLGMDIKPGAMVDHKPEYV